METLSAVILVVHLIVTLAIIITILIQPSEAGGFMGGGSGSNLMMQRRLGGDGLTRATTILAGIFFATSLFLAVAASHHPRSQSILDIDAGKGAPLEKPDHGAGDAKPADPDAPAPGDEQPAVKEPGKPDPAVKEPAKEGDKMGAPDQPKKEELHKPSKKTKK